MAMHSDNCEPLKNQELPKNGLERSNRSKTSEPRFRPLRPSFCTLFWIAQPRCFSTAPEAIRVTAQPGFQAPPSCDHWARKDRGASCRNASRPCHLQAPNAQDRDHRLRPSEPRKHAAESWLLIAAVCLVRPTGEAADSGLPASRKTQWPVCTSGYGTPELRFAVGTGSARSHFSCDAGHPSAVGTDYVRQRRRDVGYLWTAAGRLAISPASSVFPEDLRGNDLLRHRRSTGASRGRAPGLASTS